MKSATLLGLLLRSIMRKQYQAWIAISILLLLTQITVAQNSNTELMFRVWVMDVNQPNPEVVYTSRNTISLFGFSEAGNLLIKKKGELLELFLDNLLPYVKQVPKPAEVFVKNKKIWIRYSSGEKKQVVDGYPSVSQPILAPDETKLLFTVKDKKSQAIWIANIDGTEKQRIYEVSNGNIIWPKDDDLIPAQTWSPDGNKFCFYVTQKIGDGYAEALAIADITTGNITRLPDPGVVSVVWSSDENKAVYLSSNLSHLRLYDLEAGTHTQLTAAEGMWHSYSFSPEGDKVACGSNRHKLVIINVTNREVEFEFDLLKTMYAMGNPQILATKFFPTGDKLAFVTFQR